MTSDSECMGAQEDSQWAGTYSCSELLDTVGNDVLKLPRVVKDQCFLFFNSSVLQIGAFVKCIARTMTKGLTAAPTSHRCKSLYLLLSSVFTS